MVSEKISVMVVSHDSKIRESVSVALHSEKYGSILCGDGEEALESIKMSQDGTIPPKLIVIEDFLPKIDGFEVVNRLQEYKQVKESPILMLISRDVASTVRKIRLGADAYAEKPFETEEIRALIHSMIKHFRAHAAPHPVTGLMGHPQMEQEVLGRLNRGDSFGLLCVDINHFKPYNDHCGIEKGNEVLHMTVNLIQSLMKSASSGKNQHPFLAHLDGDDFILLVSVEEAGRIRQELREKFKTDILKFYSAEERRKGLFYGKDRQMKESVFPLMDLSTAVLHVTLEKFVHYGKLISEANELLRQAKVGAQDVS